MRARERGKMLLGEVCCAVIYSLQVVMTTTYTHTCVHTHTQTHMRTHTHTAPRVTFGLSPVTVEAMSSSFSSTPAIKEGFVEKKGHSAAFLMWPR